jgi:hypothetical protein
MRTGHQVIASSEARINALRRANVPPSNHVDGGKAKTWRAGLMPNLHRSPSKNDGSVNFNC